MEAAGLSSGTHTIGVGRRRCCSSGLVIPDSVSSIFLAMLLVAEFGRWAESGRRRTGPTGVGWTSSLDSRAALSSNTGTYGRVAADAVLGRDGLIASFGVLVTTSRARRLDAATAGESSSPSISLAIRFLEPNWSIDCSALSTRDC